MQPQAKDELISVEDAQRATERFILGKYEHAKKINSDKVMLKMVGIEPVYEVEGDFTIGGGFLSSGTKKLFKIQVHGYSTKIVGFEIH